MSCSGSAGHLARERQTSRFFEATPVARLTVEAISVAALFLTLSGMRAERAYAGGGTLIVAMTAGDIPVTTGNPDQGFEGYRFVGYNLYDALVLWDLSKADKPSDIKPGLATEWHIDKGNSKRWIFK